MRIEIRGRNVEITDELRGHVNKRFRRVGRQVSELATLDVEVSEERNPSIEDSQVAEATLHLKGLSPDVPHDS
jgi:putative sigma-54 modulation protein